MKPVLLWNSIFTASQISSDQEAAGFENDNLAGLRPYKRWKGTSTATQTITLTLGSSAAADAIGVVGHNLKTANATLTVQYWNGSTFVNVASAVVASDKAFIWLFTSQTATIWRLSLSGLTAIPEIGAIILGPRLTMERYASSGFDPDAQTSHLETTYSGTGNMLGTIVRYREREFSVKFQHLTPAFVTASVLPAWDNHLGLGKPFFFGWDLTGAPTAAYFCNIMNPTLRLPYDPVRRSFTMDMRAVVE